MWKRPFNISGRWRGYFGSLKVWETPGESGRGNFESAKLVVAKLGRRQTWQIRSPQPRQDQRACGISLALYATLAPSQPHPKPLPPDLLECHTKQSQRCV